jgi:septal ring factor EnvC (AmiA/AmiB activator)
MRFRSLLLLLLLLVGAGPAVAATRVAGGTDDRAFLRQLADAQRGLSEGVQQLRERLDALTSSLAERKDDHASVEQDVRALRDEVKGLYVESASVKQQIETLREDVGRTNSNISGFRSLAGFFLAAMLLLIVLILVLTIRR